MSMIKLDQVSKIYNNDGVTAIGIQNVSCEFNLGEFVAITGESGSGKSTMLNVVSMTDSYEEGELFIDNRSTVEFSKADFANYRANYVSFIFQEYNLVDSFSVLDNVMLPLLSRGHKRKEAKRIAIDAIEKVGLTKVMRHKATHLSGGEKQRTVIARALVSNTPIIACDEPTGNLDSETAVRIIDLLKKVAPNKLILYVTHDFESIAHVATRKITMADSHLVEDVQLKPANENVEIEEVGHAKTRVPTVFSLGFKDVLSTPKKSILSLLIASVISLSTIGILTGAFSLIEPAKDNIVEVDNSYAEKAHFQSNKVLAFGNGKNDISLGSIKMADNVVTDWGSLIASQSEFQLRGFGSEHPSSLDAKEVSLIKDGDELLPRLGRAPSAENEFALGVSPKRFKEFESDRYAIITLGHQFTEQKYFTIRPSSLKSPMTDPNANSASGDPYYHFYPTGVYLIDDQNDSDYTLLFNVNGLNSFREKLEKSFIYSMQDFDTKGNRFKTEEKNPYATESIYIINNNSVTFQSDGYNSVVQDGAVDCGKIYIPAQYYGFDLTIRFRNIEITIDHEDPSVQYVAGTLSGIYIHAVKYHLILANSFQQASYYTVSEKAANNVNKTLLDHSVLSYRSDSPQSSLTSIKSPDGYKNILLIILYASAFIVSSMLIAFLGSLILGVIYNSRKKDYAIYLSLSFSNIVVRFVNMVEMMLFFVVTSIISYGGLLLTSGVLGNIFYNISLDSVNNSQAWQGVASVFQNTFNYATSPLFIVIYFIFNILFATLVSTWIMNKFMKKTLANNLRKGGELL